MEMKIFSDVFSRFFPPYYSSPPHQNVLAAPKNINIMPKIFYSIFFPFITIRILIINNVFSLRLSSHFIFNSRSRLSSAAVPFITISPENQKVKVGENAALLCAAEGNPAPQLSWTKDENPLKYSKRIHLATDNKTLNIDYVKETDGGLYACVAGNVFGVDEATAQLDVIVDTTNGPPNLIFEPEDLEAIPGTTIELPCGAEGALPIVVSSLFADLTRCSLSRVGFNLT